MEVITTEVFRFEELSHDSQLEAVCRVAQLCRRISLEDVMYFVDTNRYRFFKNGLVFDALGIEELAEGVQPLISG